MSLSGPDPLPGFTRPLGTPQGPVSWFALRTLLRSGREAATATKFARFADARQAQAGVSPAHAYNLAGTEGPFHLDYVADTGDGYDATFAVARSVEGSTTEDEDPGSGAPRSRAHLLVLGGDEVYPFASVKEYDQRLRLPFQDAMRPRTYGPGFLVALPGNHDWYDGLNQFRRNFCESHLKQVGEAGAPVGFEQTPDPQLPGDRDVLLDRLLFQSRSYFAVRLPHGWWLWGVDSQLDSYIDTAQLAYFTQARELIEPHERVIMCFPRPSWTDDAALEDEHFVTNRQTMTWFVERMFGMPTAGVAQVPLVLSGDKHHYVHYTLAPDQDPVVADAPTHLITCGGGGAYLSSTHHSEPTLDIPWHPSLFDASATTTYERQTMYPSKEESEGLRRHLLRIPRNNGAPFIAAVAAADLALSGGLALTIGGHLRVGVPLLSVSAVLVLVVWVLFSMLFGRKTRPTWRGRLKGAALGLLHASGHVVVAVLGCAVALVVGQAWGWAAGGALVAVVSALVFPAFLWFCDRKRIHWHENEFFAGMRFEGYKSHLRLTIEPREDETTVGRLTVAVHVIDEPVANRTNRTTASSTVRRLESYTIYES